MKIGIIGTGYVGLVLGAGLSDLGNWVVCGDIDEKKIDILNSGGLPIYEPGLKDVVDRNRSAGRLKFTTDIDSLVKENDIIFIAVGTPPDEDGSADLSHVLSVARSIGKAMNGYKLVVVKSTVPVGTVYKVKETIRSLTDHDFDVASNPEFLKEGKAVNDFFYPDRIIIGTESKRAEETLKRLFSPLVRTNKPIITMDIKSAELTKYAANAMLATRISFMNELARLADAVGADISKVRQGIGADPRIGSKFLFPGVGYGGSCFPKDVKALIHTGRENGVELKILKAVDLVNEEQKQLLVERIKQRFGQDLAGMTFGIWGLAFKPDTDDMREAPAITIINGLLEANAGVKAYDQKALNNAKRIFGDKITFADNMYDAAKDVDALVVVTEWKEFREPDFDYLKSIMKQHVIYDGRNIYDPEYIKALGFEYYGIGRR